MTTALTHVPTIALNDDQRCALAHALGAKSSATRGELENALLVLENTFTQTRDDCNETRYSADLARYILALREALQ